MPTTNPNDRSATIRAIEEELARRRLLRTLSVGKTPEAQSTAVAPTPLKIGTAEDVISPPMNQRGVVGTSVEAMKDLLAGRGVTDPTKNFVAEKTEPLQRRGIEFASGALDPLAKVAHTVTGAGTGEEFSAEERRKRYPWLYPNEKPSFIEQATEFTGGMVGMAVPGGAAFKAAGPVGKLAAKVGGKIGQRIAEGAATGVGYEALTRGRETTPKELAEQAVLGGALGGVVGGVEKAAASGLLKKGSEKVGAVVEGVNRKIESVPVVGDVYAGFKKAQNRFQSPAAKAVIGKIRDSVYPNWHDRAGGVIESFNRLGLRKDRDQIRQWIESGDPRGEKYSGILTSMLMRAKAVGVPVSGFQQRYFPRMMKDDIANIVRDDILKAEAKIAAAEAQTGATSKAIQSIIDGTVSRDFSPQTREIIEEMVSSGQVKTYMEAMGVLRRRAENDLFNPLANLVETRTLKLPDAVYESDAAKVLTRYTNGWAKTLAMTEAFGPDEKILYDLLSQIPDEKERQLMEKVVGAVTGKIEQTRGYTGTARKVLETSTAFELGSKIGGGFGAILNVPQVLVSSAAMMGWGRTIKGVARLADPSVRSRIRKSGATLDQAIIALTGESGEGATKIASKMLKGSGFTGVNAFNQYTSASIAELWINDQLKLARGATKGLFPEMEKARAINELARIGIDHTKRLGERDISRGMYRVARDTQLQRNVLADPVIFNDPRYRPLVLFKRFGVRQALWVKDQVMRDLVQNGNPMPLIRLAAGGVAGGEGVIWAKNKVKEMLSGKEITFDSREDMTIPERIADDLGAVGGLGVVSLILDADNKYSQVIRSLTPVQVSTFDQVRETVAQVMNEWDQYDHQDVMQRAVKPASKLGGGVVRAMASRVETPGQQKSVENAQREAARRQAIDAIMGQKPDEATRIYQQWNNAHPDTPLFSPDENLFDLTYQRYFNAAKKRANP